jgi:hypothetical protein
VNAQAKGENIRAASAAYDCYQNARQQILRMAADAPVDTGVAPSESKLLADLDGLWHAGPEAIAELRRRYGKAISGVRRSKYEGERAELARIRLNRDRRRLLESCDASLWVGEPPALGGFGLRSEDTLYNEDTLQFFRMLSLLNDASVLREFRTPAVRPTLWEIGGGWGGFAHCFKTLFPNVTYLITAAPTLLLLSATYLTTLFPAARVRFLEPSNPDAFWRNWSQVDFAFAPHTILHELQPENLALTVDIGMLERMSAPRVVAHVRRAFDLSCRYVLSVRSDDEPQRASNVRSAIEQCYWIHPMAVPAYLDRRFGVRNGAFLLGWRRLRA